MKTFIEYIESVQVKSGNKTLTVPDNKMLKCWKCQKEFKAKEGVWGKDSSGDDLGYCSARCKETLETAIKNQKSKIRK